MIFNSFVFAIFLPIVFSIFWVLNARSLAGRNFFLLAASSIFYGWWDPRFLALIYASIIVDYLVSISLSKAAAEGKRRLLLGVSLFFNLGLLFTFKYLNFFIESFIESAESIGFNLNWASLSIILPVGISFYTFQTLSYTIDVYRRQIEPSHNFISFAAFVSFFPQLVAGPIERASNLLPQFGRVSIFDLDEGKAGLRLILFGLFKKVVVADNCAPLVNNAFEDYANLNTSTLIIAVFLFSIQIYGDFSGYSDIAIGVSKLLGFNLMRNFAYPYFSQNIAEFWRRWHISLTTWFRDYVYFPLGGSRVSKIVTVRNTLIVFLVSGVWHGASWNFVVWGMIHALLFVPFIFIGSKQKVTDEVLQRRLAPTFAELIGMISCFSIVSLAWVFFRAESLTHAVGYFASFSPSSLFKPPDFFSFRALAISMSFGGVMFALEWFGRDSQVTLSCLGRLPLTVRWTIYYSLIYFLVMYGGKSSDFIYFQF